MYFNLSSETVVPQVNKQGTVIDTWDIFIDVPGLNALVNRHKVVMIVVRSACIYRCFKRSTTALLTINQNHHYNQTFVAKPRLLLLPILLTTKLLLLILFPRFRILTVSMQYQVKHYVLMVKPSSISVFEFSVLAQMMGKFFFTHQIKTDGTCIMTVH